MKKFILIFLIAIVILSTLYFIYKPFIISNSKIYFKKDNVGSYTIYKANQIGYGKMFEVIYKDGENKYCFSNVESHLYLLINESEKLTIQEALEDEKVTINELMKKLKNIQNNCPL